MTLVVPLSGVGRDDVAIAGGKGANLGDMIRAGLPVPPGFLVTTDAYREFVAGTGIGPRVLELAAEPSEAAAEQVRALFREYEIPAELGSRIVEAYRAEGWGPVAVRSSATAEDLADASFAGQQDTYLNIHGADALLAAVRDCWASLWTARAMDYRARRGVPAVDVALAVVVQELVDADAAGVMFTADPASGRTDRTAISAAWGLGESVVSGTVTPDDLVVDTATGAVVSRRTASKDSMTVRDGTGTGDRAVPEERRRSPVLDDVAAAELTALGARIQAHFGVPQDIEWARAGGTFAIVQSRPITALPEPTADTPTDWTTPYPDGLYFRASIVEQLPDPLTPLFADMIDGAVSRSLRALMARAFGNDILGEDDLRFPTVNGYAYYFYRNSGFRRLLWSSPSAIVGLLRGEGELGVSGWREHALPRYELVVADWTRRPAAGLDASELIRGVGELLDAGCVYYTAVQSVVPIAAMSEMGLRAAYDRLVRRPGDPEATVFLLGFDSLPIRAEKSLYDLARWAGQRADAATALRDGRWPTDPEWTARFDEHLGRYGHVLYNLDFATPVPADDPTPLLGTLRMYLDGHGGDPHERQRRSAEERERAGAAMLERLDPVRRSLMARLLGAAQDAAPAREDGLADIGLAWPVIRRMLRELGSRLVAAGVVDEIDDVFWVRHDELTAAAVNGDTGSLREDVAERRALWRGRRRADAPQMLPVRSDRIQRFLRPFMPAGDQDQSGHVIRGVAGGPGSVTATARVLAGPEDADRLAAGDVLVARMTTPAWTSLFAMASGVVTDVGGPLSHSSIVAREYGIPAVLGTGVATRRLAGDPTVHVDGDRGTVTVLDGDDTAAAPGDDRAAATAGPDRRPLALVAGGVLGMTAVAWLRGRRRAARRRG